MEGRMEGRERQVKRSTDGRKDGWKKGKDRRKEGQTDGRMDGREGKTGEKKNRRTEGRMEGRERHVKRRSDGRKDPWYKCFCHQKEKRVKFVCLTSNIFEKNIFLFIVLYR
jgi:hypothetical protein